MLVSSKLQFYPFVSRELTILLYSLSFLSFLSFIKYWVMIYYMMNCDKSIRDFNELQKKETKDTWVKCQYTMGLSIAFRIFKISIDSWAGVVSIQLVLKYISKVKVKSKYFDLKQLCPWKMAAEGQLQLLNGDRLIVQWRKRGGVHLY